MLHISTAHCILFRTAVVRVCSIRTTQTYQDMHFHHQDTLHPGQGVLAHVPSGQAEGGGIFPVHISRQYRSSLQDNNVSYQDNTQHEFQDSSHTCHPQPYNRSHHSPNTCDHQDTSWRIERACPDRQVEGARPDRQVEGARPDRQVEGARPDRQVEGGRPDRQVEGARPDRQV